MLGKVTGMDKDELEINIPVYYLNDEIVLDLTTT
jgi:hypothetical protein